MSRSFRLDLTANDDLGFKDALIVEDGNDVRFHDVAAVVERYLAMLRQLGTGKVQTRSQVEAESARLREANAIMAAWEPTGDGVNVNVVMGQGQTYDRNWQKGDRVVLAPCDGNGNPTLETAWALRDADAQVAEA
jgi:hypothetical protein